jgi:hypothetical protein
LETPAAVGGEERWREMSAVEGRGGDYEGGAREGDGDEVREEERKN